MHNKFKDISFEDFSSLIKYLSNSDEMLFLERVSGFFPDANGKELFEINFLCSLILENKPEGEQYFNVFKDTHPDLSFDMSGRSKPKEIDFNSILLDSLDELYRVAMERLKKSNFIDKSKYKIDSQVYNGKNLSSLRNMTIDKSSNYNTEKIKFLKFNKEASLILTDRKLKDAENNLMKMSLSKDILLKLILKVTNKKMENCKTFIEHFLERLSCAANDYPALKSTSNKEFYEALKTIEI